MVEVSNRVSAPAELGATDTGVSVWSATASLGLTQAVTLGLHLGTTALLSRLLGSQGMGLYTAFIAGVALLSLLADPLGYRWVNTYLVRRGEAVRAALGRSALYALGMLVLAALVFWVETDWLVAALERLGLWSRWEGLGPLLPLLALALPVVLFNAYVAAILLGLEAFREFNGLMLLGAASLLAANALLWVTRGTMEVRTAAWVWIASYGLAAAWGWWRLRARSQTSRGDAAFSAPFGEVAATGFRAFSVNLFSFLHLRVDIYLVGFFLTPAAVGLYAVAVSLVEMLARAPALLGTVIYPKSAAEREGEITRLIGRLLKLLPLVALVGIPAFWLIGRRVLVLVFGAPFGAGYEPALWLLPGVVCLSGITLINNFLAGKGYPGVIHAAAAASLTVNLVLNWLWIPRYGTSGAAMASSVSYGLWFLVLALHFRRRYLLAAAA